MNRIKSVLKLSGYPIDQAVHELNRIAAMSVDEHAHFIETKKWELARFHYNNNVVYKELVGPHFPSRWEDLPIISKKDFSPNIHANLSLPEKGLRIGYTSGSTGVRFRFARDKFCHAMTWATAEKMYNDLGIGLDDYQARFFGAPHSKKAFYFEMLKDYLFNRHRFVVNDLSKEKIDSFIAIFKKNNFRYIYGYANSITFFCRNLKARGINLKALCPSLTCCIVTAEQCSPADQELIRTTCGVPVFSEYGASEVDLIAMTNTAGQFMLNTHSLLTESVNDFLVFTPLFNRAFPLVRFQNGDMGRVEAVPNSKDMILTELMGRINEVIQLPSGKVCAGNTFHFIISEIERNIPMMKSLLEYQFIQYTHSKYELKLIIQQHPSDADKQVMYEIFSRVFEPGLELDIKVVDDIPRKQSGKFMHFVSHVNG